MRYGLTGRQSELLRYIESYVAEHDGVSPSFQEMKDGIGAVSKSTIFSLVNELEDRGAIIRLPRKNRTIVLTGRVSGDLQEVILRLSDSTVGRLRRQAQARRMSAAQLAIVFLQDGLEEGSRNA